MTHEADGDNVHAPALNFYKIFEIFVIFAAILCIATRVSLAQSDNTFAQFPKIIRSSEERETIKRNMIGIVAGLPDGVYTRIGADIMRLVEDRADMSLRVVVVTGNGSVSNIDDLLNLYRIDFAIVQGDVIYYLLNTQRYKALAEKIRNDLRYVVRLHDEFLVVVTRKSLLGQQAADVCWLDGKSIAVGGRTTGASITVPALLEGRLGLKLDIDYVTPLEQALRKLKDGETHAVAYVVGKGAPTFSSFEHDADYQILAVPKTVLERGCGKNSPINDVDVTPYQLGRIYNGEYRGIRIENGPIPAISVPAILAVYNWGKNDQGRARERFEASEKFVKMLFEKGLRDLGSKNFNYNQNWCGVDFSATINGWGRFSVAQKLIEEAGQGKTLRIACQMPYCSNFSQMEIAFRDYLRSIGKENVLERERTQLSQQFESLNCPDNRH